MSGLNKAAIRGALIDLETDFDLRINAADTPDTELEKLAIRTLKSAGGFHAQFVEALPSGCIPAIARRVLETSLDCALGLEHGHRQL